MRETGRSEGEEDKREVGEAEGQTQAGAEEDGGRGVTHVLGCAAAGVSVYK